MSFFCLLWVPLFYLLRRSLVGDRGSGGSVWALLLGSITAIIQFFLGYLVSPGGFGFSRWLFGFIDLVSLPVLLPLVVCFIMLLSRGSSRHMDFANFALLWLIPVGALRALSWSSLSDPILLVLVPLLWTAVAVGISFFINWMMRSFHILIAAVSIICILILPLTAAAVYWAFFSQMTLIGFALLIVIHIPLGFSFLFEQRN